MKGFYNRRAFLKDPTQHGAAPKAKSFNRSLFASGRRGFGVDGTTAAGDAASERNLSLAAGAASPAAATARGERVMSVAIRTSSSLGATVRWDGGGPDEAVGRGCEDEDREEGGGGGGIAGPAAVSVSEHGTQLDGITRDGDVIVYARKHGADGAPLAFDASLPEVRGEGREVRGTLAGSRVVELSQAVWRIGMVSPLTTARATHHCDVSLDRRRA